MSGGSVARQIGDRRSLVAHEIQCGTVCHLGSAFVVADHLMAIGNRRHDQALENVVGPVIDIDQTAQMRGQGCVQRKTARPHAQNGKYRLTDLHAQPRFAALLGFAPLVREPAAPRPRLAKATPPPSVGPDLPSVEVIRGDKRAREVVRQEQQ